ncbi:hypothetical protein [Streptomyces mirabilis]|uniref:hypothetical protein n=1 Tax=Streptomyces mirabilis TaxID=68239 RepID=UPI003678AAB5
MSVNAFTATAVSTLNNGDSLEHVRETLGLSESELADALHHAKIADAVQHAGLPFSDADTEDSTSTPEAAVPASVSTTDADQIEALLAWAEKHSAATIRNRAARVRSDLPARTATQSGSQPTNGPSGLPPFSPCTTSVTESAWGARPRSTPQLDDFRHSHGSAHPDELPGWRAVGPRRPFVAAPAGADRSGRRRGTGCRRQT